MHYKVENLPAWASHAGGGTAFDVSKTISGSPVDGTLTDAKDTGLTVVTITGDDQRGSNTVNLTFNLIVNDKPDCDATAYLPDAAPA